MTIRLRSSGAVPSSLSIAEVLSGSIDWLQVWLQSHPGVVAEVVIVDERGARIEIRLTEPPRGA